MFVRVCCGRLLIKSKVVMTKEKFWGKRGNILLTHKNFSGWKGEIFLGKRRNLSMKKEKFLDHKGEIFRSKGEIIWFKRGNFYFKKRKFFFKKVNIFKRGNYYPQNRKYLLHSWKRTKKLVFLLKMWYAWQKMEKKCIRLTKK